MLKNRILFFLILKKIIVVPQNDLGWNQPSSHLISFPSTDQAAQSPSNDLRHSVRFN